MSTAQIQMPVVPPALRRPALSRVRELHEVVFVLLHAPLGLSLRTVPYAVETHALSVIVLGLHWSSSRRTAQKTIWAAAYLAGAEVLWRMSGGAIAYELGKYGTVLLLVAATVRLPGWRRPSQLAVLYFLLLLPSVMLTVQALGLSNETRRQLSFNLSGPLALAVAAFVLSGCRSASIDLRAILVALLAPLIGIAAVAGRSTITADVIRFGGESNFVTSGGFGPNQVSAALGLGALVCLFLAFRTRHGLWRWSYFGLAGLLITQAVLTFSRGGVINAAICSALLGVHFLRQPRARTTLIAILVVFGALGSQVILPALDRFTGGALTLRYGDLDPSLRQEIAEHELGIFLDHPILGVGPGRAKDFRRSAFHRPVAAHTEYTRLLAEHGMLGLIALLLLLLMVGRAYLRAPTALTQAWVATFAGWAMLEMLHAAMRIAATSLLFGLALLEWRRAMAAAPPPIERSVPGADRLPPAVRPARG